MLAVPGGQVLLGSDDGYPEEAPRVPASVAPFLMDRCAVSNAEFARFVEETGYLTVAERPLDPADFPGVDPALLVAGSACFRPPDAPVDLRVPSWWTWTPGARWSAPEGPGSSFDGREDHPVVHVAYPDAAAYADWAGKALPTEAEWEFAARAGLPDAEYAWGDELAPGGRQLANIWQGAFPHENLGPYGAGTAQGGSYPPNAYGLHDLIGNVWEWTSTVYDDRRRSLAAPCCGATAVPSGAATLVLKGGSFLCSPSYCARYRPAARVAQDPAAGSAHLGFRCVVRPVP